MKRPHWRIVAAIMIVIPLGLLSRSSLPLPDVVATYAGDTLYASLIYLLVVLVWNRARSVQIGLLGWGLCLAIELSQLYHAPWLDTIRATGLGHLVLGEGFVWSDLICYGVGTLLAAGLDRCCLISKRGC